MAPWDWYYKCKLPNCDAPHVSDQCSGDLIHATISSVHPRLKPPDISTNSLTAMMPPSILEPSLEISDVNAFKAEVETLMELYAGLSALQLRIFANLSTRTEIILPFTQLSIALEYRLLSLAMPLPRDTQSILYAASHTVLKICTFLMFREFSARTPTLSTLETRLRCVLTTLYESTTGTLDTKELKMLLWILWMGALAAREQEWYVSKIEELINALDIGDWSELKVVLDYHVWSTRLEGRACWELCGRVGIYIVWKENERIVEVQHY